MGCKGSNNCNISMPIIYENIPGIKGPIGEDGNQGIIGDVGPDGPIGDIGNSGAYIEHYDGTEYESSNQYYEYLINYALDVNVVEALNYGSIVKIDLDLEMMSQGTDEAYYKVLVNDEQVIEESTIRPSGSHHQVSIYMQHSFTTPTADIYTCNKTTVKRQSIPTEDGGNGYFYLIDSNGSDIESINGDLRIKVLGKITGTDLPSATKYLKLKSFSIKIFKS